MLIYGKYIYIYIDYSLTNHTAYSEIIFLFIFFSIPSVKYFKRYRIGHKHLCGLLVHPRRLRIFKKKTSQLLLNCPPPHHSFTQFPSPSQSEYTKSVQAERIFGKPQFGNIYVNMSTSSNFFVFRQKFRAVYMKRESFTVPTAMRCSAIQTISDCWIAVRKMVTRTRQKFLDLYLFPVFNIILHCTLM